MKTFLFVCMGNTCRSPMAEAIMNDLIEKRALAGICTDSCGIAAFEGAPANEYAAEALGHMGIFPKTHCAKRISLPLVKKSVVLCMEKPIADHVRQMFPEAEVYELCAYASVSGSIPDPYGLGDAAYAACAEKLEMCISRILDWEENGK